MIFSAELLVQTVLSGLMVGVLYALMALGITFIYSIVKTINWAMGEFYMIGSYIQFVAVHYLLGARWWWLAAIISAAGTFLVGLILEPILIKPMYARPMQRRDDYATVVTIALSSHDTCAPPPLMSRRIGSPLVKCGSGNSTITCGNLLVDAASAFAVLAPAGLLG